MSHPDMPHGGTPDFLMRLRDCGYVSNTELCLELGLPVNFPATWIANRLKVVPHVVIRNGQMCFWLRAQVEEVRAALIRYLGGEAA